MCRALSSVTLSSVRSPALGPALTVADGFIWCVLFMTFGSVTSKALTADVLLRVPVSVSDPCETC